MMKTVVLLAMLMACVFVAPAGADGIIIVDPPPNLDISLDEALNIKYHRVNVTIEDQVANTRVDQVFVNPNDWEAEGTYIFPLPEGAAVSDFVMWVDGKPVRGEILEAEEARAIYEDIVRQMRDPALLEYVGRNALKASVYPIPPGGERRIQLEYSQVLPVDDGLVHYVYPLSTEKYSASPLEEVAIGVSVYSKEAIKAVYSPSHEVFVERKDDHHALMGFEDTDVLPDKDFELYYSVAPDKIGLNLLSYKEAGEDGFFLLLAAPKVEVAQSEIQAKDVILVLDTSGSMEGEKLDQAKEAAKYILEHLNPEDRFNVVAFSTGLKVFEEELSSASKADDGADFVDRLEALGGTNINRALLEALSMAEGVRPTTLIFLTDGLATEGVQDTPTILKNVKDAAPDNMRIRLFAFGVGDDVDTDLLDQLSLEHGGMSTYVRPDQKIDETVNSFYSKISNPVLSDIEIDFGDIRVDDLFPQDVPDLFAGSQIVQVGRYRDGGETTVTLSGMVNDRQVSYIYPSQNFSELGGAKFIPRLWATRAIGHYLTEIRLYGEKSEWVDSIVDLSIRYGIITPYTSFLIDEKDIFTASGRDKIARGVYVDIAEEAAAPSSGAKAVERAAFQGAMSYAAAPMGVPDLVPGEGDGFLEAKEQIKQVGSKTFVLRNATWTDTAFDPTALEPEKVEFLSERYFELIAEKPDLGDYFALGTQVIAVYEGHAYQVVDKR
jgi:Ca-activated chloride channel family protein